MPPQLPPSLERDNLINEERFYFRLQSFLPAALIPICLALWGVAALVINDGPSGKFWPFITFIKNYGATLQGLGILALIAGLVIALVSVILRNRIELQIININRESHGNRRHSFWDAFPFASLVFFSVVTFTLCDIAASSATRSRFELLAMLGMYLVGAISTSIVVLYGAHLVNFEERVTNLTGEIATAASGTAHATDRTERAATRTEEVATKLSKFTKIATATTDRLTKLEVDTGTAILGLYTDLKYRSADQTPPVGYDGLDPYIRARSCLSIRSNEAVFLDAEGNTLRPKQRPVARNMISTFLEEMAWDLGQRRLVTNARNYTGFLVGAARGFEEYCKTPENEANQKLKVFYLTHTVVTPPQLLNWPHEVRTVGEPVHRLCQPKPFMLEYMTYCRYFAAKRDRFIHGRLISALRSDHPEFEPYKNNATDALKENPSLFKKDAVLDPMGNDLPTKVASWGIPHWGKVAVDSKTQFYHSPNCFERTNGFPYVPEFPSRAVPFLFAAYGRPGERRVEAATCDQPCSLHWPLFYDDPLLAAPFGATNTRALMDVLRLFLTSLGAQLAADPSMNGPKHQLLAEAYGLFCEKVQALANFQRSALDDADEALKAFEFLQSFRWAFQHKTSNTAWEDLRSVLFVLVNVLLAREKHCRSLGGTAPQTMVDFRSWFVDTFHTNPSLAHVYERDDNHPEDPDYLGDKEFALIGLIELERDDQEATDAYMTQQLSLWKTGAGNIKELVGLRSTIAHPWKHAEVEWRWPCSEGKHHLEQMVDWYVAGFTGSGSQSLC